jgi:hypothetical protein
MSSDKFGDKLRDKEKAEEDRYFAEQDRKKLEQLRDEDKAAPQLGLCPKCGAGLVTREIDGIEVDGCDTCAGFWLEKGEFERIVERESEGWASRWIRSVLDGK